MKLPGTPVAAWDAIPAVLVTIEDPSSANDAVFPAACELWRFIVVSTLHAIWIERLRRIEDSTILNDTHITRASANLYKRLHAYITQFSSPMLGMMDKHGNAVICSCRHSTSV